jgi:hypothetical protein
LFWLCMCSAFLLQQQVFVTQQEHINPFEKKKSETTERAASKYHGIKKRTRHRLSPRVLLLLLLLWFARVHVHVPAYVRVDGRARRRRATSHKTENTKPPSCTPSSTPYSYGAVVAVQSFTYVHKSYTESTHPRRERASCRVPEQRARGGKGDKARRPRVCGWDWWGTRGVLERPCGWWWWPS